MEDLSGKSLSPEVGLPGKGSTVSYRNQSIEDKNSHCSNKAGSNSRPGSLKARTIDGTSKSKFTRESFPLPSTRVIHASSCRTNKKSREDKQKQVLLDDMDIGESSNNRDKYFASSGKYCPGEDSAIECVQNGSNVVLLRSDDVETLVSESKGASLVGTEGVYSNHTDLLTQDIASSSRPNKQKERPLSLVKSEGCSASVVHRSNMGRNPTIAFKSSSNVGSGPHKRGLKNLVCTSISDVLPPSCSSAELSSNRRVDAARKRASEGESSTTSRRLNGKSSTSNQAPTSSSNDLSPLAPERVAPQQIVRRPRIFPSSQDNGVSVRTRRASSRDNRVRISEHIEADMFSYPEIASRVPQNGQSSRFTEDSPESLSRFPVELQDLYQSYGSQSLSNRSTRSRSRYRMDESSVFVVPGVAGESDGYHRVAMDGIAEVLFALERFEHDEGLSYEQLMVLEANLFLGGLSLHDQHRDMRMDIDNMTYEELLALEEQIGNVSTALSEEQLVGCVNRRIFVAPHPDVEASTLMADDIKCCICQEEYVEGEEVGKLRCKHQYHVSCVHQWLKQKNWCPICKAAAAPA